MAIINLEQLAKSTGPLMGLDPGTKTLGLAISDETRLIASPLETIKRKKFTADSEKLFKLYDDLNSSGLIMGLPLNMDGSQGPRVQSVKDLAQNLLAKRDIPIFFWDERLSTAAVTRTLLTADSSRAKRSEAVDKLAASYILQGVLDRLRA